MLHLKGKIKSISNKSFKLLYDKTANAEKTKIALKGRIIDLNISINIYITIVNTKLSSENGVIIPHKDRASGFRTNNVKLKIYDMLYDVKIEKTFVAKDLNHIESIVYELIGKFYGIYTESKPDDLKYFDIVYDGEEFDIDSNIRTK